MFRKVSQDPHTPEMTGGSAALSMRQALPHAAQTASAESHFFTDFNWTPDLGSNIGSREWWRGLGTCAALSVGAFFLWSGLSPVQAREVTMGPRDQELARAQVIAPLAWGGDTGRRMAPTDAVQSLVSAPERPTIQLAATLGQGDSFQRLLERSGVGGAEARQITGMVSGVVQLDAIAPGTHVDILLGRRDVATQPRPVETLAFRAALDMRLEFTRAGGALAMHRVPIAVDATPLRIRGKVGDSLYRSARAAGASPTAIQAYLRVIAGQVSLTSDIRADDEYDIIVAHRRAATGETEVGDLLYAGLVRNGQPRLRMIPWKVGGQDQWYEASGVGQQRTGLAAPVNGRLTSNFGARRHPILGYVRMHAGVDFGAPYGSPIFAVSDGVVDYSGYRGGYGRYVRIRHDNTLGTGYAHMSRLAVAAGQPVKRGQIIGYVGSSGLSTGPHLHYELYRNGTPVNPMSVQFQMRSVLEGPDLAAFRARIDQLTAIAPGAARGPVAPAPAARAAAR